MLISSLKPNVTRERAGRMLSRPLRRLILGKLRLVLDFYIPYRMFEVTVTNREQNSHLQCAVDSVTGNLDHYRFDQALGEDQVVEIDSNRAIAPKLNEEEALENLRRKLIRQAFLQGFFKISDLKTDGVEVRSIHLPYWVGVYERGGKAQLEVIDAVRGQFEGAKVREIFSEWFQKEMME